MRNLLYICLLYTSWRIPVEEQSLQGHQDTRGAVHGGGGYYFKILSDARKIVFVYAGASALAGYEAVNLGKKVLHDGSTLHDRDAFIYGDVYKRQEYDGTIIPVELAVYDTDGQPGIFIPNSMEMNAVREVAANMGGSLGSSINISTNAGAQLASDLGKGLIQGTSQYIAKKMRTVKVHLKSGYKVMLYQDRD